MFVCMQVQVHIYFFKKSCDTRLSSTVSRGGIEEKNKAWFIGIFKEVIG